jgi:uncharacterized protein (DUF983 family)
LGWNDPIYHYCERVGPNFWAEPFNAWSNLAFLLAAVAALALWRERVPRDRPALVLILIVVVVALGSFLFHTFAVRWAFYADVIPIGIFIACYIVLALMRYFGLGLVAALACLIAYEALFVVLFQFVPPDSLNRSVLYLPALAMLGTMGVLLARQTGRERAAGRLLLIAAGLFVLSLVFRTVDLALCAYFPLGTHFLWHCLNGALIYGLLRAAILHGPRLEAGVLG